MVAAAARSASSAASAGGVVGSGGAAPHKQKTGSARARSGSPPSATSLPEAAIAKIRAIDGNATCCDCGAAEPDWGDVAHGSLHCMRCIGQHRALGVSTSVCRSLTMDYWTEANLLAMLLGGNRQLRSFFERQRIENSSIDILYRTRQAAYYREQLAAQVDDLLAKRRSASRSASSAACRTTRPPKATGEGRPHDGESRRSAEHDRARTAPARAARPVKSPGGGARAGRRPHLKPRATDFDVEVTTPSLGASLTRALPPPGWSVADTRKRGNGSMALVTKVASDGAAKRAGVRVGDYAVAINGRDVADYDEFVSLFPRCPRPARITVRRFEWIDVPVDTAEPRPPPSRAVEAPEEEAHEEERGSGDDDDGRAAVSRTPSGSASSESSSSSSSSDACRDDGGALTSPDSTSAAPSLLPEDAAGPPSSPTRTEEDDDDDDDDDESREDEHCSAARPPPPPPSGGADESALRLVDFGSDDAPMGFSIERDARDMARVSKVAPGGRAAKLGVRIDDVVVSLNGRETTAYDVVVATLPVLPKPLVVGVVRWGPGPRPLAASSNDARQRGPPPPHQRLVAAVAHGLDPRAQRGALASKPPSGTSAGNFGARLESSSSRRPDGVVDAHRFGLGTKQPLARALGDDREFDVRFVDGPIGMRIEERLGLVPVTVVTHVDPAGQAWQAGVRTGCTIIGLNGERYLSHAHAAATLRHAKRPLAARLRHAD